MPNLKKLVQVIVLTFFLLVTVFVWYGVGAEERDDLLTIIFLDVGQGDAILIETPQGQQVLIDGGSNKQVLRELAQQLPFYDKSLDVLIATHPDRDHIGGFPAVLEAYQVSNYFNSGVLCETALCDELGEALEEEGLVAKNLKRGTYLDLGQGVYLEVLFPDRDVRNFETNLSSLVLKLIYGETAVLLTGDSPREIENYLIALNPDALDVDVLKLGHHGSKTSSGESWLGFTSPQWAVISVGADNRYGHPHQEVLDLLKEFAITTLRTDELGTIVFQSDGERIVFNQN